MNCVPIKMGGNGVRFGSDIPKQFYQINEEPLFVYVLKQYLKIPSVENFILVSNAGWMDMTEQYAKATLGNKLLAVVEGGDTNAQSIRNGVKAAERYLSATDILLIHDVTDPIVNVSIVNNAILAALRYDVAAVVTEQVHTLYLKSTDDYLIGTIAKQTAASGYSPEAFNFGVILALYENATDEELHNMTSAVALAQAHGISVKAVFSHQLDLKITYREDMESLKLIIKNAETLYL